MKPEQIALQMWTIRDVMEEDFTGAFAKVAKAGYRGVEIGEVGSRKAKEIRRMLDDFSLKCIGHHVGLNGLENEWEKMVDFELEIGNRYIVCSWLEEARRKDASGYRQCGRTLDEIGKKFRRKGLCLCYHNHAFEFEKFEGQYGYDILFESAAPENLKAELDVYWVTYGGEDAVGYVKKMTGRLPLLHMKDRAKGAERTFCEVGEGIIDMKGVVAAGDKAGVEWYIVEQDVCRRSSLDSVKLSYANLCKLSKP